MPRPIASHARYTGTIGHTDQRLPKLVGGVFHPYRRLWATERKQVSDIDVAAAGGCKDTATLKLANQQADPADVLRVVEGA